MDGATAQRGANAARGSGKPQDLGGVIDSEKSKQGVGAGGRDEAAWTKREWEGIQEDTESKGNEYKSKLPCCSSGGEMEEKTKGK